MRTLLTILLVYLIIRMVLRIIGPIILQVFFNKVSDQFQQQANGSFNRTHVSSKVEGEVSIDKKVDTTPRRNEDGEYVDYVEVK